MNTNKKLSAHALDENREKKVLEIPLSYSLEDILAFLFCCDIERYISIKGRSLRARLFMHDYWKLE
jgi:hypothetical protein